MTFLQVYFPILSIILGFMLLFFGQKMFWLFVGLIGFLAGFGVAEYYFVGQPDWVIILAGVFSGFLGVVLATYLERIAVSLVGILTGGYLGVSIYLNLFQGPENFMGAAFVLGGIIGGITFILFFDWCLILFSALFGALLITHVLSPESPVQPWVFLTLFISGVIVQIRTLEKTPAEQAS